MPRRFFILHPSAFILLKAGGLGVQVTPRRSGVDVFPDQTTGRIGECDSEVRGAGVRGQPVLPERRVQQFGTDGRRQFDADCLRRGRQRSGLVIFLVAVVLQHAMLPKG